MHTHSIFHPFFNFFQYFSFLFSLNIKIDKLNG